MAVGVVVGLTIGPKSSFLEHDLYTLSNPATAPVYLEEGNESSRIVFPKDDNSAISFIADSAVSASDMEAKDNFWVKGHFTLSDESALLDGDGSFREALGLKEGERKVAAWIKIEFEPLASGGKRPSLVPVSAFGTSVIAFVKPVGTLFMRLIKMVIVPLVFASLLVGVAGLGDIRKLGRMGGRTLLLYLFTTAIAVSIGLASATLINPGSYIDEGEREALQAQFESAAEAKATSASKAPSTIDNLLNIVPTNPVASLIKGKNHQGDMLQIIFFALIFGIALTMMGPGEGTLIVTFFDKIQQAMVMIIHMVMKVAPYGVAALLADVIGNSGWSVLKGLFAYGMTVVVGLSIHAIFVYGGLVRAVVKISIPKFLKAIRPAQLLAFSTSSSSAALPVSMECAEENLGVSNSVSSFVLPLGSTVNMDGTALYQGVAAIFIAQAFQVDLSLGDQLTIVLSATVASIGAAGVPGAGMITLAMVLTAVGIPASGVALILGMDRLLDMFRTAVNVTGDLSVTAVMAVTEGESVQVLSHQEDVSNPDAGFENRLEQEEQPVDPQ